MWSSYFLSVLSSEISLPPPSTRTVSTAERWVHSNRRIHAQAHAHTHTGHTCRHSTLCVKVNQAPLRDCLTANRQMSLVGDFCKDRRQRLVMTTVMKHVLFVIISCVICAVQVHVDNEYIEMFLGVNISCSSLSVLARVCLRYFCTDLHRLMEHKVKEQILHRA